jgi:hypothetical protein
MVTSSAARSRTGSSSVATSRTASRRAKSQPVPEASAQPSPVSLASESPDANRDADSDVEIVDQEEGVKRFIAVTIEQPVDFDRNEYELLDTIVAKVLEEVTDETDLAYKVRFKDTHVETVSVPDCSPLSLSRSI